MVTNTVIYLLSNLQYSGGVGTIMVSSLLQNGQPNEPCVACLSRVVKLLQRRSNASVCSTSTDSPGSSKDTIRAMQLLHSSYM